jgi:hypothetical protein
MQETRDTTHAKVMPGYKLISKSGTSKHGGGDGFLIRSDIAFKQNYSVFIEGLFESMSISFTFEGQTQELISLYKPPNTTNEQFLNFCKMIKLENSPQ